VPDVVPANDWLEVSEESVFPSEDWDVYVVFEPPSELVTLLRVTVLPLSSEVVVSRTVDPSEPFDVLVFTDDVDFPLFDPDDFDPVDGDFVDDDLAADDPADEDLVAAGFGSGSDDAEDFAPDDVSVFDEVSAFEDGASVLDEVSVFDDGASPAADAPPPGFVVGD
jgi:hypothetical protein